MYIRTRVLSILQNAFQVYNRQLYVCVRYEFVALLVHPPSNVAISVLCLDFHGYLGSYPFAAGAVCGFAIDTAATSATHGEATLPVRIPVPAVVSVDYLV